jgi:hypothetical protein
MGITMQQIARVVRRIIFAAMVMALLAPVVPASVVHAAGNIQYVSYYLDSPGAITDCRIDTGCSLRDALHAAADGDTIQFVHSTPWPMTYTLSHGTLTIGHSVTIQGPGAGNLIISGGGAVSVFTVTSGVTTTISGVTIANGHATFGGGITNTGGTINVTDSTLSGNVATYSGGGIYINGGTVTVVRSTVSGNSGEAAGGIDSEGGASLTVTNSTFSGNSASVSVAGGIANDGLLTVTNSTFSGNSAATDGGGIDNFATLTVTGSTFSGNSSAAQRGGGIFNQTFSRATVTNSTLSGNTANSGGGIYFNGGTATMTNVTLASNSAPYGGGIGGSGGTIIARAILLANPSGGDCNSVDPFTSNDYNLASDTSCAGLNAAHDQTGVAPGLDPNGLQPNGGTGPETVALLPNSPAIDAGGGCPNGVTTDERGQPHIGACDIGAYEYQPAAPTLMDATGPSTGGPVTFHGTGFQTGSRLTLGSPFSATRDAPASVVSADGTSMTLDLPPGAAAGPVAGGMTVTNPGPPPSARATFTYLPVITGLSPSSGAPAGGGSVTITGVGFAAGVTSVAFGGTPATAVRVDSGTQVTVTAPAHGSGAVDVTVTVNGLSATKPGAYTYGTVNPLPTPQRPSSPPASGDPPGALPPQRPAAASAAGGSPSPLPPSR